MWCKHRWSSEMTSLFRVVLHSRGVVVRPLLEQRRRYVSQLSAQGNFTWLLAGCAGVVGITSFMYYRTGHSKSSNVGFNYLSSQKTSQYAKTGSTHPEAEAEQLISSTPPPPPPATPIVSTEVLGEVIKPTVDTSTLPFPSHIPYVLVGAGTASFSAAKAIREKDPQAKVLIVGEEELPPYSRPPLSKQLWLSEDHKAAKQLKFKAVWAGGKVVDPFYKAEFCDVRELPLKEEGGIALLTGRKVVKLNPSDKKLTLDDGSNLTYDKCLLATGGRPRTLPVFEGGTPELKECVSLYRTIPDYLSLDELVSRVGSILVVGGGFLGSELAVAVASRGRERGLKVTQLFPEEGNLGLVLPRELSKWTTDKVRKEGVEVYPGTLISKAACEEGKVKITTEDGKELEADHVVVAVGLDPNTQLAESARLETDTEWGGYRVNSELQACTDIWAAGDVSCYFDPYLGRRRVEHHDHANVSGRLAGENMTGTNRRFKHQSMFWSDIGPEVGFEATGIVDAKLPTTGIWARATDEQSDMPSDDYSKGVVFYLQGERRRIVGILTWNLFGKMDLARAIIAGEKTEADIGELAVKFDVHQKQEEQKGEEDPKSS